MIQRVHLEWHYLTEWKLIPTVCSRIQCHSNKYSSNNISREFHTKQPQKFSIPEQTFSAINSSNNNKYKHNNLNSSSCYFNLQKPTLLNRQLVDKTLIIIAWATKTIILIIPSNCSRSNSNSHPEVPLLTLRFPSSNNNLVIFAHPNYHSSR